MCIKDDIPGFYLNTELQPGSQHPRTLPPGFDYEVPMSLNAETCLSEFRNIEKIPAEARENRRNNVLSLIDDMKDLSDMLYNAYADS